MANITLGGNPTTTNGDLPQKGQELGDFTFTNNDMAEVSLSDYRGKKVILNIFPSVDTGVCATSIRKFNESAANLDNTVVLCISQDLPFAQKRFCGAEGIDNAITLSTFRNDNFAKQMGVAIEKGPFAGLLARSVVVLNEEGKVTYTQLVEEVGNEPDYESALKAL